MKRTKNNMLYAITLGVLLLGCSKDFENINSNPNAPQSVDPQILLTNVMYTAADRNTYEQGFRLASYLSQFSASVEFERIDRYEMGSNGDYWNTIYRLLSDIRSMQELPNSNDAYNAVGEIMSAFLYSQLTDLWNDVPYLTDNQALEGNYTPVYDTQESIYMDSENGIIARLKKASQVLESTNATIAGDIMYEGDLQKWIRFSNSLQFRYLMRVSKRLQDHSELQALLDNDKLMKSNADNAVVSYLNAAPNQWPLSQVGLGLYQEHRMTATVDSILKSWDDPRIFVLYKPTQKSVNAGAPTFHGLANGQSRETISAQGVDLNDISLYGSIFRDAPDAVNAQFMQISELYFAIAEAAQKKYISGDPASAYKKGILASFAYYGVDIPSDYFEREEIRLDGTPEDLNKILTQKWLSLITIGHEAWFNVRRTGIPSLRPGPDNLNDDQYPVRYLYPESEQATNKENYQEASDRIGGDHINSKGWWEKD